MVRNEWIIRRMGLVEAELWGHHFQQIDSTIPGSRFELLDRHFPLGQAFVALSPDFERLQRRVSALERSTRRAIHELAEIRRDRDSQPVESEPPTDQIGFVPPADPAPPIPNPEPQIPTLFPPPPLACGEYLQSLPSYTDNLRQGNTGSSWLK